MKLINRIFIAFITAVVLFSPVYVNMASASSESIDTKLVDEKFPVYYSSNDLGYIIPAESQGESNSCWAFSSLGVLSAYAVKNGLHSYENADFSEAHLAWFTGNSRSYDESDSLYGDGISSEKAYEDTVEFLMPTFALAKGSGIAFEKDYPFYSDNSTMGRYEETERYNHSAGWLSESVLLNNSDDIKKAVIENGAVQIGIYYNPDKLNDTTKYIVENDNPMLTGSCAYYNNKSEGYGHAVVIVGWNDDYPKENFKPNCRPQNNGAWLCKNSWGTSWGENGLFWISYENADLINPMALACVSSDAYDNVYQYDGFGFNRCITAKQFSSSSVANVFTSNQTELIEAVGFYTYQQALYPESETAVDIEINIYKNVKKDYTNPTQGDLAIKCKTTVDYSGYHTFKLPNSVPLTCGETYSVVITMSSCENTPVVLFEGNETEELKYHANEGESFISLSGKSSDFFDSAKKYGGNVCVKAFTKNYDGISIIGIEIPQEEHILHLNDTLNLEVTVRPLGIITPLLWESSDETVAVTDDDGTVKCVGEGDTIITVSIPRTDFTASCHIKVLPEYLEIEWINGDKTYVDKYKYGDSIILPESPNKMGYIFKGWSSEIPDTMPPYDLKFDAIFEPDFLLSIRTPSVTEINYGDKIVLHADITGTLPTNAKIKWTPSNNNFDTDISYNGTMCTITPISSGDTTFTVSVIDSNGNVISSDEQVMTSKAGFFDKIIAFFKKLFGLTKTIPQIYKGIF